MASQLEGVAELTRKLNELGAKTAGKELRGAVRAAAKIAYDKAKAAIPVGDEPHKTYKGRLVAPGFAQRSLRLLARINRRKGSAEALIGVRREAFYALSFVELGTSRMGARPWLRPAFESSQDSMLRSLASELKKRIERIARRGK